MMKMIRSRKWLITMAVLAIAGIAWLASRNSGASIAEVPLIAVKKGTLQINVLQGGEVRALQNYEVKSEIELPTKILSLIPEGYRITEQDVKDGKALIELDSADLKDKITQHEIDFQTTVASYIDADEARAIQNSDNLSLSRDAEQAMRFAMMDFERYMGKEVAEAVLRTRKLPGNQEELDHYVGRLNEVKPTLSTIQEKSGTKPAAKDPLAAAEGGNKDDDAESPSVVDDDAPPPRIDFLRFLTEDELGDGEAQQRLRQLTNESLLHQAELAVAKQKFEASQRLAAKDFITKTTLENDKVNHDKADLAVQTAETQLDLFKKYEFPKQAEQFLSAYEEALKKLQRTLRSNRSRMAQAESRFQTAKRRYEVELSRKEELDRQLKAAVIKAPVPGLIAYGSHNSRSSYSNNDAIEEGASVRFRQTLLTIPDMSAMSVSVSVHESQVKKVRLGQPCRVTVDAEPGKTLEGIVAQVAVLPDSTSSRYTPNLKVYPAVIHIKGVHDWLKPGMNAKVEIIVNQLDDILYVPVQSIEVENDHYFTYVRDGGALQRREVKTGQFNNEFIEIKGGLALGDEVALALPKRQNLESNPEPVSNGKKSGGGDKSMPKEKKGLAAATLPGAKP